MCDSSNEQLSLLLPLPNGKKTVNVATKEGANELLQASSKFFPSTLKKIENLRKKKRLNDRQVNQFIKLLKSMNYLPLKADCKIFRAKVPKSEIQHWLNFAINEIKIVTKNQEWIDEGDLNKHTRKTAFHVLLHVLQNCSSMFHQEDPVNLALEGNFFQVLADLIKAPKGRTLPNEHICSLIGSIVCSIGATVTQFDTEWSLEGMYDKFEESGMLEQILRCSTVPLPPTLDDWDPLLTNLLRCQNILETKFKRNKPCGQTLKAILEGHDGHAEPPPAILDLLQKIAVIVKVVYSKAFRASKKYGICGCCLKSGSSENKLFKCSNECGISYCSEECQRADWKLEHKSGCKELRQMTPADRDRYLSKELSTATFLRENSAAVFRRIEEECASTGLEARDLVVEVDFMPSGSSPAPALCDPPMFEVVPIRDYVSGAVVPHFVPRVQWDEFKGFMSDTQSKNFMSDTPDSLLLVQHGGKFSIDNFTIHKCRHLFESSS